MYLLNKKGNSIKPNELFKFVKRNNIRPIKKTDVNTQTVTETLEKLKTQRNKHKWASGDNDLKIISIYYVAGISSISTNNKKDFTEPCKFLGMSLEFPPIIEPGSIQDVNKMLRNLYKRKY